MRLLKVVQLSKSFDTIRAVDSVSFEVRLGEIYGLMEQVRRFGSGFREVLAPLAMLCAFGAVANLLAARFFRS